MPEPMAQVLHLAAVALTAYHAGREAPHTDEAVEHGLAGRASGTVEIVERRRDYGPVPGFCFARSGSYELTFSFWDGPAGGTKLGGDVVRTVNVLNGAFATVLSPVPATAFDGDDVLRRFDLLEVSTSAAGTVFLPGHDEYYSAAMRQATADALRQVGLRASVIGFAVLALMALTGLGVRHVALRRSRAAIPAKQVRQSSTENMVRCALNAARLTLMSSCERAARWSSCSASTLRNDSSAMTVSSARPLLLPNSGSSSALTCGEERRVARACTTR